MKKQLIWFFGASASGKRTFIEAIINDAKKYKDRLCIANDNLTVCKEALEYVTKKNHEKRGGLLSLIDDIIKQENEVTVLIKGQTPDLQKHLLDEISIRMPEVEQVIVFLYVDPNETLERWKSCRHWYESSMTKEDVISEINYQLGFLHLLQKEGIVIVCVDGASDKDYPVINFLPTIPTA